MAKPSRYFHAFRAFAASGLALAGSLSLAAPALADNHPERQWLVKDSAHFSLHYYAGIEGTASRLLQAAESAYPKLSADFGVKKIDGKIPIIINQDAYFNGEAEPGKDRITLDPLLASSSVIGTQRFVAHELAHIMTFASVDSGNKMAKLANVGGMPTWFLEGIAQYEAEYWYPSNDRMLRLATLENGLLTDTERDNFRMFGVYSGAAGYNEGYSLCRYMFGTYGRDKVATLMATLKDGKHTFEQGVEITFGQNMPAIEAAWKASLKRTYAHQVEGVAPQAPGATLLVPTVKDDVNVQPRLSPDGKQLAYMTSRYQDSFLYLRGNVMGFLSLYVADADGRNPRMIPIGRGAINQYCWSADSSKLLYSRMVGDTNGNPSYDLFAYNLATKSNERLTTGEMANTMAWRPGHDQVLYVSVRDGRNTVKIVDTRTKKTKIVFQPKDLTQYEQPAWSPDGERVTLVSHAPGEAMHLVNLDPFSGKLAEVTPFMSRQSDSSPVWTPDGKHIVFSSDRGGMANLYQVGSDGQGLHKLTDIYRGAEMPTLTPDGKSVYYTSYRAKGSEIYRIPLDAGLPVNAAAPALPMLGLPGKPTGLALNRELVAASGIGKTQPVAAMQTSSMMPDTPGAFDMGGLDKMIDKTLVTGDARPYQAKMTNDVLMPEATSDEKGEQVGVAGIYSDILDKNELGMDIRYGIMSQRFSYLFQYTNNMFHSSWQASIYDQPQIALSPDVGNTGQPVTNSLYFQRQRGAQLAAITPFGNGVSLFSGINMGTLSTLSPPLSGDHGQLKEGQLNTLHFALRDTRVRQTVDMDINPSDGYALDLDYQISDHNLLSGFNYSQYVFEGERYFSILPDLRQNLTWRWDLGLINGDAPQPFLLGGANVSNPIFALRGYAVGQFAGNRLATTGLEYTIPLMQHIDKQFGPMYLDRLYVSAFTDVGDAWNQGESSHPFASAGGELRLKMSIMGQQILTVRLGLAQQIGSSQLPGFYLTF